MVLKITLQSGETQEVPFELTSTITVTNETTVDGLPVATTQAWTDIVAVELVEGAVEAPAEAATTEPVTPVTETVEPDVPEHDEAVAAAGGAVDQAIATGETDHLAQAIADVDAALAVYPDSAELADAKQQLTELQADTSTSGS